MPSNSNHEENAESWLSQDPDLHFGKDLVQDAFHGAGRNADQNLSQDASQSLTQKRIPKRDLTMDLAMNLFAKPSLAKTDDSLDRSRTSVGAPIGAPGIDSDGKRPVQYPIRDVTRDIANDLSGKWLVDSLGVDPGLFEIETNPRGPAESIAAGEPDSSIRAPTTTYRPAAPSAFKMRCPKCQKLYSVAANRVRSATVNPLNFKCVACESQFGAKLTFSLDGLEFVETAEQSIAAPKPEIAEVEAVVREPQTAKILAIEPAPVSSELRCPKCGSRNQTTSTECRFCGVVFGKIPAGGIVDDGLEGEIRLAGRRDLADLWAEIKADYDNVELHERFLAECLEANCLGYASQKYSRILMAAPQEETAQAMKKKIIALASVGFERTEEKGGWNFRVPALNNIVLILAGALIVMGMMVPGMKNLTGLGMSALALALFVRFFLKSPEGPRGF